MSGYRALAGWGKLKRSNSENDYELPKQGTVYVSPETLIKNPDTWLEKGGSWKRFGAGCNISVTVNRNINFHNDIGIRTYTVATTGLLEADFSITGYVAADRLEWLEYGLNAEKESGTGGLVKYHYENLTAPKLFDIAYVQANSQTNSYHGKNEWHILTGCAINTVTINYELSSDAGVQFTIEGYALMDYFSLSDTNMSYTDFKIEEIPKDVFSTACVCTSTDNTNYITVAQTDSASITINNFLERRGNCLTNCSSGYSMGTLNVEMNTSTYSNDPKKYLLALYGHNGEGDTSTIYSVKKVPYAIPYFRFYTDDSDSVGGVSATKKLSIVITDTIASQMQKEYNAENAIMDNPTLRGKDITISVVTGVSNEEGEVNL